MAMPMQISLDEVLSMLLTRVDSLSVQGENTKNRFNVLARALYKKGLLTDQDLLDSLKDEHQLLLDLGAIQSMPDDEALKAMADNLVQWLQGDAPAIKKSMEEYEAKIKKMVQEEQSKPRLDVASAADLKRLDRLSGQGAAGSSKLLLP